MPAGMPRFAPNQTPPIQRTAPPLPASGSWQPIRTRLPSGTPHPGGTWSADGFTAVCNGRSCLNETCLPAAIVQDRRTLSRPIADGLRQPRDNLTSYVIGHHRRCHVCRRPPPDDALRRSLRCECRCDLVSQRSDHRDGQPARLVFGRRRIAATDTSNPNHEPHTRQHQLHLLHNPSFRLWMDSDSPSTD
jgi:hypothetical protein